MLFSRQPKNWRELEAFTYQLFSELDCNCDVGRRIKTVRGSADIDVYVEDPCSNPPLVYLCECKYWKRKIPKTVVHSLRTLIADSGSNRGYIIANAGFQKGAIEAAYNSNIELVTWQELQGLFKDRWIESMNSRKIDYIKQITDRYEEAFEKGHKWELVKDSFLDIFYRFACFTAICIENLSEARFTAKFTDPFFKKEEKRIIEINSIREYFDVIFNIGDQILQNIHRISEKDYDNIKWVKPKVVYEKK